METKTLTSQDYGNCCERSCEGFGAARISSARCGSGRSSIRRCRSDSRLEARVGHRPVRSPAAVGPASPAFARSGQLRGVIRPLVGLELGSGPASAGGHPDKTRLPEKDSKSMRRAWGPGSARRRWCRRRSRTCRAMVPREAQADRPGHRGWPRRRRASPFDLDGAADRLEVERLRCPTVSRSNGAGDGVGAAPRCAPPDDPDAAGDRLDIDFAFDPASPRRWRSSPRCAGRCRGAPRTVDASPRSAGIGAFDLDRDALAVTVDDRPRRSTGRGAPSACTSFYAPSLRARSSRRRARCPPSPTASSVEAAVDLVGGRGRSAPPRGRPGTMAAGSMERAQRESDMMVLSL